MTRNMYVLTTKNPHFVRNRDVPSFLRERYLEIFYGKNTPEDSCPFDELRCDECKFFSMSHGCHLAYKEGGK